LLDLWPVAAVEGRGVEYSIEVALAVLMLIAGWWLGRRLGRRTRELRASEERWRTMFEHAGVVMIEEDFTAVVPRLDALRAEGVTDLRAHLIAHPALAIELFTLLRVSAANRAALTLLGGGDLAGMNAAIRAFGPTAPSEAFLEKACAIWERRPSVTLETSLTGLDGVRHLGLMQCVVPTVAGRPDFSRVLVAFTNLTALRASEERHRQLFEQSPVAIVELDSRPTMNRLKQLREAGVRDLTAWFDDHPAEADAIIACLPIVRMNRMALRLLAAGSVEEVLANLPRILTREAVELRRAALLAVWEGRNLIDGETRLLALDGTARVVYQRWWVPFDGDQPRYERTQLAFVDLTGTKLAEAAQRLSETRSRAIFEHSPVALVEFDYHGVPDWLAGLRAQGVTDLDAHFDAHPEVLAAAMERTRLTELNAAAVQLVGASSKEEVLANLGRIFSPEAMAARRSNLLALWRGEYRNETEYTLTTLAGRKRRIFHRWWMTENPDKTGSQWAQTALIDITDIRAAEAALVAEQARLAVTLRAMTEGVITTDPTGVVQFMNEAAGALTGWTPAAAVGRPIDEICRMTDEKQQRTVLAPVASALAHGAPMDLPARTELAVRTGGRRAIEGRCAPMHDPAGRGLGAVFVLRDVTEKARFETEILRASKLESVGLLAGGIAHDFNNLLAIVMGNLTLALLDEKTAAAGGRWLREAERGTSRARELTQQLLTFARGGEPVRTAVLLGGPVREAAEFALHGANVRCEFDLADDVRPADADQGQIGQVVQNLVINAVQAMPAGGVIRLTLRNETLGADSATPLPPGDYLRLEIADTGQGIAPEHLARMFEPFFTTKENGTGLGLATVYSIVQKHRGHVAIASEVGRGTTFRIWLPAAQSVPAPKVASAAPFDRLSGRVLFMDDEEPIRVMTRSLLERLGLEVVVTADGHEAVQQFERAHASGQPFDAVIVDLTVPGGMGGAAAMSEILKLDPAARGIVSSGYSSDPVMAEYRAHGFRGSVPKPYKVADFARTLRAVLQEK
jgi:PAS domain S-box-containing protein